MRIRTLTTADTGRLVAFYLSLSPDVRWFYGPFPDASHEQLGAHLEAGDRGEDIVLGLEDERAGAIVGHGYISGISAGEPILGIGLHQDFIGVGWGRRLLAEALRRADDAGATRVVLTVLKDNHRAWRLYEKMGFVRTGEASFRCENDSYAMERARPQPM